MQLIRLRRLKGNWVIKKKFLGGTKKCKWGDRESDKGEEGGEHTQGGGQRNAKNAQY